MVLLQKEVPLYGSSRIGLQKFTGRNFIGNTPDIPSFDLSIGSTRGQKYYEQSNHLGNILATVTDLKVGLDLNDDGIVNFYEAEIASATDYYPFGWEMPGRKYNSAEYRYGFNGKEKDDDGEFGSITNYDYGFRIYNPAVGRFLSVDPLSPEFPWYTPYQFAGNKPIVAIDLDGLEEVIIHSRTVGKEFEAALDNGDVYDGLSAMKWLSRNNHKGKYPNGVLRKPWANTGDYEWLKDERGKGFSIPNEIAQFTYTTSESSSVMWMEDFVDVDGNIGVMYNMKVFLVDEDGERYTEDAKFIYTIDGGYVMFADGAGAGDLDLGAGTTDGGSYGSIDWGDPLRGGGAGFQGSGRFGAAKAIANGFKWAVGLFSRGNDLKEDPAEDLGEESTGTNTAEARDWYIEWNSNKTLAVPENGKIDTGTIMRTDGSTRDTFRKNKNTTTPWKTNQDGSQSQKTTREWVPLDKNKNNGG